MTDHFSEDHVMAAITRLTRAQLTGFIQADFVRPDQHDGHYSFRRVDIARLELLCDLSQDLELNETALGIVISLIDQLHSVRQERMALRQALNALPEDLRAGILAALATP